MPPPSPTEFTVDQATDLAKHFLGPGWFALFNAEFTNGHQLSSNGQGCFLNKSWRAVFRDAGVKLPYRERFSSIGKRVLRAGDPVAVAVSGNLAERIANALNDYEPGSRGK